MNNTKTEIKKYGYIDALRGLAILGVLYVHNYNYFDYGNSELPNWFLESVEYGQRGVQLFFIASAFTLCLSLQSRMKNEKHFLKNFFMRRFFRIAPLFYIILIYVILNSNTLFSITNIISNFSFIYVLHPIGNVGIVPYSWTIGVEMFFYLLFPLLFFRIKNLSQAINFTIISSLIFQLIYFISINNIDFIQNHIMYLNLESLKTFFYRSILGELPVFSLGFIFYHFKKEDNVSRNIMMKIALAFLLQIIFGVFFSDFLIFSIGLLLFCIALSYKEFRFFVNPLTIFVGKVSYSMYLIHAIILLNFKKLNLYHFVDSPLLNLQIRFTLLLLICSVISFLTYNLIEKPGIRLGSNLIKK
jgi:peptidoglycan/LPS O-acetylase OafA/YrhL